MTAGALLVFWSSRWVSALYVDRLWFAEIDQSSVWSKTVQTKVGVGVVFAILVFAALWGNIFLAERKTINLSLLRSEEELVERYQELVGPFRPLLRNVVAVGFALLVGYRSSAQWRNWLLFRHGQAFERQDPVFGHDAGFYVFKLPFISFVVGWLFAMLLFVLVLVVVLYYLNGQIRVSRTSSISKEAKLHISALLACVALTRAASYWIDRYELLYSDRRRFSGALATDINLLIPGLYLLTLISVVGALLLLVNVRREGWGIPMVVLGLWLLSHILIVGVLPVLYQNFRVDPQEVQREKEFVERNIEATRYSYGLERGRLEVEDFKHENGLTEQDVEEYDDVLSNVPVLDPRLTSDSFSVLQGEGAFYQFSGELDIDRYEIDGEVRPAMISVRGLQLEQVDDNWERQKVSFTHGYGLALASGVEVDNDRPVLLIDELATKIPVDERLNEEFDQPRIYFGENFPSYSVVGARADEVDFKSQNKTESNRYDGDGGIDISSLRRQLAFAINIGELDPLISENIQDGSKLILNRDIETRVREVAPFLRWDSDPYPVLADGDVYWMVDGYSTTNRYPYGQQVVDTSLTGSSISGDLNYLRNSVKAVINAYTGETNLFIVDDEDPVISTWSEIYPGLFDDLSAMPMSIQNHLRYPVDAFTVQSDVWARYHVSDVEAFIQDVTTWSVARQPARDASSNPDDAATQSKAMEPQYIMAKLPGNDESEFVLQRAYVPRQGDGTTSARPKMQGLIVARSDPGTYGQLTSYEITGNQPNAPELIHSDIQKVDGISDYVTLRSIQGSDVKWGPMSMAIVDDTVVFVRPVYVLADGQQSLPELRNIIAVNGDRIAMRSTLDAAIDAVVSGAPATVEDVRLDQDNQPTGPGSESSTPDDEPEDEPDDQPESADEPAPSAEPEPSSSYDPAGKSIVDLLADADRLLAEADTAEDDGDDARANELRDDAQLALTEATRLVKGG